MREIRVTVNPDGTTKTDMIGYQGKSCLEEAERLRQLLASYGIQSLQTSFEAKPELLQTQAQEESQANQQRQGEVNR